VADLHIHREHKLGLPAARKIAYQWAAQVKEEFDMECTYEEGSTSDVVRFVRSGVKGTLHVTKDHFDLDAKLGFLVGAFKGRIEAEIVKNLDTLLAGKPSKPAKTAAKPVKKAPVKKK